MKRSSVLLARCLAFVETYDLAPNGRVFFPDVAAELVARYRFQKFPKEFGELDEIKGIEFLEGCWDKEVIHKMVIYSNGLLVDTRSSTRVSREIIEGALVWAKEQFGLTYEPEMIRRFAYVSQVTFHSELKLDDLNPALKNLAKKISSAVNELNQEQLEFQTSAFAIAFDPLKRKNGLAQFTLSPRVEVPFSDHKYFSESPLETDTHWRLLEEFESALLSD